MLNNKLGLTMCSWVLWRWADVERMARWLCFRLQIQLELVPPWGLSMEQLQMFILGPGWRGSRCSEDALLMMIISSTREKNMFLLPSTCQSFLGGISTNDLLYKVSCVPYPEVRVREGINISSIKVGQESSGTICKRVFSFYMLVFLERKTSTE